MTSLKNNYKMKYAKPAKLLLSFKEFVEKYRLKDEAT